MTSRGGILIVEDHTMIAEYLASVLAAEGFEAIQAHSLAQARQRLAERAFELWLCDRNLPDGDSSRLLGEWPDRPPAIVLSADLDARGRRDLLAAGFADALAKPCPPNRLLASVARVLDGVADPAAPIPETGVLQVAESTPVLDDAQALARCGGERATVDDLRNLLAAQLPQTRQRLRMAAIAGDEPALAAELHGLAGAAGWIGAEQVAACLRAVQACLHRQADPASALTRLDRALAALLQVLKR
jgi:DNA-binding response OmpR family regulator